MVSTDAIPRQASVHLHPQWCAGAMVHPEVTDRMDRISGMRNFPVSGFTGFRHLLDARDSWRFSQAEPTWLHVAVTGGYRQTGDSEYETTRLGWRLSLEELRPLGVERLIVRDRTEAEAMGTPWVTRIGLRPLMDGTDGAAPPDGTAYLYVGRDSATGHVGLTSGIAGFEPINPGPLADMLPGEVREALPDLLGSDASTASAGLGLRQIEQIAKALEPGGTETDEHGILVAAMRRHAAGDPLLRWLVRLRALRARQAAIAAGQGCFSAVVFGGDMADLPLALLREFDVVNHFVGEDHSSHWLGDVTLWQAQPITAVMAAADLAAI